MSDSTDSPHRPPILPEAPIVRRVPLPRWTVPVVALVVLAIAVTSGLLLWLLIDSLAPADAKDRATAMLEVVKIAASIAVGGGGIFALYLAVRRQRTQELDLEARHLELSQRAEAQKATDADAEARRITELYGKSAEQLGSEKAPVRLAGLYALERLAQDNPGQRQTVINVLCAYLRMPYMPVGESPGDDTGDTARVQHDERAQERQVRLTAQRILTAHLDPGPDPDHPAVTLWSDLDLDLTDATLIDLDLSRCHIHNGRFDRANFIGTTSFGDAKFTGNAVFSGATFNGDTWFDRATIAGSAGFSETIFNGETRFVETRFEGNAWFPNAKFRGYTRLSHARFDRNVQLSGAMINGDANSSSTWPPGWRPNKKSTRATNEDLDTTWYVFEPRRKYPKAARNQSSQATET